MNRLILSAAAILCLAGSAAIADEGMWTFDNFPLAAVNKQYNLKLDQAWLDHVRAASVRLSSGCSASIVTGEGLVLTNHHCVRDCAQNLSSADADLVKDGFQAAARPDEKLCSGMQAEVLDGISDVSDRVTKAAAGKKLRRAVPQGGAAAGPDGCAQCRGHHHRAL